MLSAEGDDAMAKVLEENDDKVNDELLQTLSGIISQSQGQEDKLSEQDQGMFAKMQEIYGAVLKYSMKKNMG